MNIINNIFYQLLKQLESVNDATEEQWLEIQSEC